MNVSRRLAEVPKGVACIRIDAGNEFLYVWGIETKSYIAVDVLNAGRLTKRVEGLEG